MQFLTPKATGYPIIQQLVISTSVDLSVFGVFQQFLRLSKQWACEAPTTTTAAEVAEAEATAEVAVAAAEVAAAAGPWRVILGNATRSSYEINYAIKI